MKLSCVLVVIALGSAPASASPHIDREARESRDSPAVPKPAATALATCVDLLEPPSKAIEAARRVPLKNLRRATNQIKADPGDLGARALLLAHYGPKNPRARIAVESAEWLATMCPSLPLLSHPSIARVGSKDLRATWELRRRRTRSASVHGNYWSYISARAPLDLKRRPTDPKWSVKERQRHLDAFMRAYEGTKTYPKLALAAFEAQRMELRSLRDAEARRSKSYERTKHDRAILEAAEAAFAAGFQDAGERYAGEYLARWNQGARSRDHRVITALRLIAKAAKNRGDESLAHAATRAANTH